MTKEEKLEMVISLTQREKEWIHLYAYLTNLEAWRYPTYIYLHYLHTFMPRCARASPGNPFLPSRYPSFCGLVAHERHPMTWRGKREVRLMAGIAIENPSWSFWRASPTNKGFKHETKLNAISSRHIISYPI